MSTAAETALSVHSQMGGALKKEHEHTLGLWTLRVDQKAAQRQTAFQPWNRVHPPRPAPPNKVTWLVQGNLVVHRCSVQSPARLASTFMWRLMSEKKIQETTKVPLKSVIYSVSAWKRVRLLLCMSSVSGAAASRDSGRFLLYPLIRSVSASVDA